MHSLQEKLQQPDRFVIGSELVSVRGSMAERSARKAREFAQQLVDCPEIDWISITDNAGGNPQLAPTALGKPILYAGKDVVIHLTCKDLNRNGLESEAWLLHSEGFHNILAMTGDYPVAGSGGSAKPVFDIDSVGLIAMLHQMNEGLDPKAGLEPARRLDRTDFLIGAVTTNTKLLEGELLPQYAKLAAKVRAGARFIINQVGYDARKMHELRVYLQQHDMGHVPLIGNVYVLNPRVARLFHAGRVPGVVVSDALLQHCEQLGATADGGREAFLQLAARQLAIYRGLGYRGAYLGGVHSFPAVARLLEIVRSFGPDDWRQFVPSLLYSRPGEFFFYERDAATGLADPARRTPLGPPESSLWAHPAYRLSRWTHRAMFTPGAPLFRWGRHLSAQAKDSRQGPAPLRALEHASKALLFRCKDCGDCSLPEIAYLCPESQCAKNQRNGPCGGTRDGRCEVEGYGDCIWLRAYERLKADAPATPLLAHAPVVQNQALRSTSSWANHWLGRDHFARPHPAATAAAGPSLVSAPPATAAPPPPTNPSRHA